MSVYPTADSRPVVLLHGRPVTPDPAAPPPLEPRPRAPALGALGFTALALFAMIGCSGCSSDGSREEPVDPAQGSSPDAAVKPQEAKGIAWDKQLDPGPATKTSMREHPAAVAWVIDPSSDEPRKLAIDQAEARGYTVIDLGDNWRPYIFSHKTPGVDDYGDNTYAARYVDLANDRTDADGDPLADHEHNYLELYGIPPTLSVVLEEWRGLGEIEQCLADAGYDGSHFDPSVGSIAYQGKSGAKRLRSWKWAKSKLEKEMRKAGLTDAVTAGNYAAAAEVEELARTYASFLVLDREVQIIRNAQLRFRCEQVFNDQDGRGKFDLGDFDGATTHALANFEKKHNVKGWGHFTSENIGVLALSPREVVHARLMRVLSERVVSAAGILEDGSARDWKPDFEFTDADGNAQGLRDLATEFTVATLEALELGDPETALARLEELEQLAVEDPEHPASPEHPAFGELLVAVKLPELPAYYSDDMQFSTTIDRGDVWYDFPWDEEGNQSSQPRQRTPKLTLYVTYRDQKIPLVHWSTTIGSWRSEMHEGKEYYAYKNSDVGDRVWQTVMAAPVWIPPESTPTSALTKLKRVNGKLRRVVNYDETGPGYTSAYGLVAGYHVRLTPKSDGTVSVYDNQIRTHGSVDYMSILRRYSHGCHRLYNMNAVRMFSMILQHRPYIREGQTKIGAGRSFESNGSNFVMKLETRGYRFELIEPIPVTVMEGRVRGSRQTPYKDMMPKPGVDYSDPETLDESMEAPLTPGEG